MGFTIVAEFHLCVLPVISHRCTVPPAKLASVILSGANTKPSMLDCHLPSPMTEIKRWLARSQIRILPHKLPLASVFPSGENANAVTLPSGAGITAICLLVSTSHNRISPKGTAHNRISRRCPPLASIFPSGENANNSTACEGTVRNERELAPCLFNTIVDEKGV